MLALFAARAVAFTPPSSRGQPPARALRFANGALGETRCLAALPRCHVVAFDSGDPTGEPILEPGTILEPLKEGGAPLLDDGAIERLFREFDTSGDGLISLAELRAGLSKAGAAVGPEAVEEILRRVDTNADGQISAEEFRAVFRLSAESVPEGLRPLTAAAGFFLDSMSRVSDALGVDVPGQWRTTAYGARYVDDVIGGGELVVRGDVAAVHYTVTLMSTEAVVETSRGGPPLAFRVGDPAMGEEQGWTDAVDGMRVGGRRRVYAKPREGKGPIARYDIEIVRLDDDSDRSPQDRVVSSLGGRRAAFRLLFAASFVPYLLPEQLKPGLYKDDWGAPIFFEGLEAESRKARSDAQGDYVSRQMDALFADGARPKGQ